MWWNYRKPRPMKSGAFRFAVKNNVPVIPVFITMEDTDKLDSDGYPVQAYTMNVLPAIYPDEKLSLKENMENIREKNYQIWKETYEKFYGIPLVYGENE
jgi:1-acyl-sn-glycerol-3-phosphate acyltransferase